MGIDHELFSVHPAADFVTALTAGAGPNTEIDFQPRLWKALYAGRQLAGEESEALTKSPTAQMLADMLVGNAEYRGLTLDLGRHTWMLRAVLGRLTSASVVERLLGGGRRLGATSQGQVRLVATDDVADAARSLREPGVQDLVPQAVREILRENPSVAESAAPRTAEELSRYHIGSCVQLCDFVERVASTDGGYLYIEW